MATVQGPDFIALQVRDLAAAARFYTEVVGLAPAPQSPSDAIVCATQSIAFVVRTLLPDVHLDAGRPGFGIALGLKTNDAPRKLVGLRSCAAVVLMRDASTSSAQSAELSHYAS